jgi:hypothetical protein
MPVSKPNQRRMIMIKIKSNKNTASLLRALLLALCLLTFTRVTTATIRYVSPTGNNIPPYLSWEDAANVIQDAINICEPGDTVLVDNGTYYENLVINTQISLIGLSMDSTIIDGRGLGDYTIIFNASGSIENFNIYGKAEDTISRIIRSILLNESLVVKNCKLSKAGVAIEVIADLSASNLYMTNLTRGINLAGESNNYISNSILILEKQNSKGFTISFAPNGSYHFFNNVILYTNPSISTFPDAGISIGAIKKAYIQNNLISGFEPNIYIDEVVDTVYILNNVISYGRSSGLPGGILVSGERTEINNVVFSNNSDGIWGDFLVRTDYNLFWNNGTDLYGLGYGDSDRVAYPMFVKDTLPNPQLDFNYHLQAYSPGIDAGNPDILDVDGSRSDIGMYGGPLGQTYKYLDLPPATPVNASAVIYQQNQILLRWLRNSEADTSHYNVYRDTVTNFAIDSTKLIASITDTFYVEPIPPGVNMLVYKITAVDQQGNQSLPTPDRIVIIVAVDEYEVVPSDYELYQNYPNPFNPSTKIGYNLKERGYVKLMVYDITGSLVSVLVNKEQEAGYYEVEFNVGNGLPSVPDNLASGIYLYRIEVLGEGRIPKFSDMKKMVFIK